MGGIGDAMQVVVQMEARGGFGEGAGVSGVFAGDLCSAERGGLGHGGGDDGELLAADAGQWKIGGVFDSKGGDVFECGREAGDLLVHAAFLSVCWLDLPFPLEAGSVFILKKLMSAMNFFHTAA